MPTSDYTPQVSDIGAQLVSRTKDNNGVEVGTFNANTRPTDAQVTTLIAQAASDVAVVIGADIPAGLFGDAKAVAVLGTALQVELTYFPEQIGNNRSPYNAMKILYDDKLKRLQTAVQNAAGGGPGTDDPLKPAGSFPMTGDPFIIGRRTAW